MDFSSYLSALPIFTLKEYPLTIARGDPLMSLFLGSGLRVLAGFAKETNG
jgi:hypothetical protein